MDKIPSQEYFAQKSYDADRQRDQEECQHIQDGLEELIRSKGITEEEISYRDLGMFVHNGGTVRSFANDAERAKFIERLEKLENEWRESK